MLHQASQTSLKFLFFSLKFSRLTSSCNAVIPFCYEEHLMALQNNRQGMLQSVKGHA